MARIAVSATSFAKNQALRERLLSATRGHEVVFTDPKTSLEGEALARFVGGAEVLLVGREPVTEELLAGLPALGLVSKYGVGVDNVDFAACQRHGVEVYWEEGVNALPVAEHTVGLMIAVARNLGYNSRLLAQGTWHKDGGIQFCGRTVGVIGCGHIGSLVARITRNLGCPVLIADILDKRAVAAEIGGEQVGLDELLSRADFVTLHVPLTDETRYLVGKEALGKMKPGSILINTSRGPVVSQDDLKAALKSGQLRGAALDVFEEEPVKDLELCALPNFIGTSHTAGNSAEAVEAMGEAAIRGITRYLAC